MTAFSFAIGGGGEIQIVEVEVFVPLKVEKIPFSSLSGQTGFGTTTIRESFRQKEVYPAINDNVISEVFNTTSKKITFNVR